MTRLLAVLLITILAFLVATYTWNRAPHVECTTEGLGNAAIIFNELAEKRPRRANQELLKLSNRTGVNSLAPSIESLVEGWLDQGSPNPRTCRRLRESLARLI